MKRFIMAATIITMALSITITAFATTPDIKANNSDSSITLGTSDTLSITVSLTAGNNAGVDCDWWVAESAPDGWYYYSLTTSWTSAGSSYTGLSPTYQGALFDLGSYSVLNTSGLSKGTYTFYFAIDTNMNGSLDMDQIYYDSVSVSVISDSNFKLPDTGQTTSYTSTFGEDSDYLINPPSYTDNGNGTVTDNNTSLMWQQEDDDTTRNWADAISYCEGLSLADHSDWRLPDYYELEDIVNLGIFEPTIDETYFPNTNTLDYWSSTTEVLDTSNAWNVNFYDGYVHNHSKTDNDYVRCVRGGQNTSDFTDNGDGTVADNVTGLMWQQQDDDVTRIWDGAISYCEGLALAGHSDWRLPNYKELKSIVDISVYNPAIDEIYFPNTNSQVYWQSTTVVFYTSYAWYVNFSNGYVENSNKSGYNYVRCVRGEGN